MGFSIDLYRNEARFLSVKQPELPPKAKMTSFEHHLKDEFITTSTLVFISLFLILLVVCTYRKTSKKFIKYSRFKIFPQMYDRKRLPEEHGDNYSEVCFLLT